MNTSNKIYIRTCLMFIGAVFLLFTAAHFLVRHYEKESAESTNPVVYVYVHKDKKAYPLFDDDCLRVNNDVTILAVKKNGNVSKVYVETTLEDARKKASIVDVPLGKP